MRLDGTLIEIGNLEGYADPTPGLRLRSGDRTIEILGLSREDIAALPNLLYQPVSLQLCSSVKLPPGVHLQPGDKAFTDFNGAEPVLVTIVERTTNGPRHSGTGVQFRVSPTLKHGAPDTWYDAGWFTPAPRRPSINPPMSG